MSDIKVIGSYISPYVRKVLVFLETKGIEYEIDPIAPFVGNEAFVRLSPLKRVPVLIDGGLVLNDSSVICQYLEDKFPEPSLYPRDIAQRARARWLEEYADTRLADGLIWRLFYEKSIKKRTTGQPADETVMQRAREVEIPASLDYLETQVPEDAFIFGEPSIADISIASYFRTAQFVRYEIDAARWPRVAALLDRTWALPAFRKLALSEDCTLRVPLDSQRDALRAEGAPLTATTMGTGPVRPVAARTT
ncbi:MAG: glutathione S-transferase family protein [Xanthomonadales bacterium]|nr:glutathione S-transferase family protein [Xanthomonadales bacterium]ODU93684.1 MAG: glutathione S-transferase [Rhodanobacter sp. SCN 66-43]OJY83352.1 MAG: glutathione S-transferase [Xanthomonadales bacterium 66-474]